MFRNRSKSRELRVESREQGAGSRQRSLSPFPLPPSPLRSGITLTEVLISLGILTLGLLGVAALFPVGSYYMQRGETADQGSALAQAAFNDAVARGILNPENWLVWEDGMLAGVPGGRYPEGSTARWTFRRKFADALRTQKTSHVVDELSNLDSQRLKAREFGSVYFIDPQGIASIAMPGNVPNRNMKYTGRFPTAGPPLLYADAVQWSPWVENAASSELAWPVRRLSLVGPSGGEVPYMPLDTLSADRLFTASDDLAVELPTQQDRPAVQRAQLGDLDGSGVADDPIGRQSQGDYSWAAMVVPTTPEARDALATDPSSHYYEVSVVVFYKRVLSTPPRDSTELLANLGNIATNERAVNARIVSTGLAGGEVLLTRFDAAQSLTEYEPQESPFENLRTGQWLMLCGPHPNSTDERPMIVARWYRVLSIEEEAGGAIADPAKQRLVALRGPKWPWQPENLTDATRLSNTLYACIPAGAVAVHAKTVQLEGNSVWSGGATSNVGGPRPPGIPGGI